MTTPYVLLLLLLPPPLAPFLPGSSRACTASSHPGPRRRRSRRRAGSVGARRAAAAAARQAQGVRREATSWLLRGAPRAASRARPRPSSSTSVAWAWGTGSRCGGPRRKPWGASESHGQLLHCTAPASATASCADVAAQHGLPRRRQARRAQAAGVPARDAQGRRSCCRCARRRCCWGGAGACCGERRCGRRRCCGPRLSWRRCHPCRPAGQGRDGSSPCGPWQ